ncbi:MAG TPA: hypothetical protein VFS40_15550 [Gemmatimonadales bacterium]|nr:hypothetical protein [Gemmatimonadales bacterium]
MRPLALAGLVLMALGAFLLFRGFSYTSKRDVVKLGPISAQVEEQHTLPTWVGGAVLVVGLGLVVAGMGRRG